MLELDSLTKTYRGGIRAVVDVSLRVPPGIYGLLGPNGAGKSTLMRILATLQRQDSGLVRLDGRDLFADVLATRRQLGYLPQELGTHPRVTAREVLEYLIGLKSLASGQPRRMLAQSQLERVGLGEVADRRLETFSGGMRQRFGIAAATLGDPRLIIVDEPTAGLDPTERRRFQALLADLARDRILLLSSHIVEDIAGLCANMALMFEGAVIASGVPADLIARLEGRVSVADVDPSDLDAFKRAHTLLSLRPRAGRIEARVLDARPDQGLAQAPPDLEDFYAAMVSRLV